MVRKRAHGFNYDAPALFVLEEVCHNFHRPTRGWVGGQPGVCSVNPPHVETDPMAQFVRWYNRERPLMSVNPDVEEMPTMVFGRKTPLRDRT